MRPFFIFHQILKLKHSQSSFYAALYYQDLTVIVGVGSDAKSLAERPGIPVLSVEAYPDLSRLTRHHIFRRIRRHRASALREDPEYLQRGITGISEMHHTLRYRVSGKLP